MKTTFSNFRLTGMTTSNNQSFGTSNHTYHADVDITTTTGIWFWKKSVTETKSVYKQKFSSFWRYADTGDFPEGHAIENLASAYTARTGEEC